MADPDPLHRAFYLTGPTASGKTAVGVIVARAIGAEVVAVDSMTLYRGMDVGTAKPTAAERGGVPHHLIDVLDPWESASVADYRAWAIEAVREIEARGRRVLFVGGTPMYLKALLRGLFEGPRADPELRARLEGVADLHARLAEVDPPTAARLHPNDRRRIIRALEVYERTGRPLSALQGEHDRPAPPGVKVVALWPERAALHARIDARATSMFAGGLVEEVRRLLHDERPLHPVPAQAAGYREAIDHLEGRSTIAESLERTRARTRQLAKRQVTWLRHLEEVRPLAVGATEPAEEVAARVMAAFDSAN